MRNGVKFFFRNGVEEGLYTVWYPNGNKLSERFYVNGLLEGLETLWDKDGEKDKEVIWKNGEQTDLELGDVMELRKLSFE